ncbi:MAG: MHS family MFS transporter [Elusimicrobia bacterium]|nr:MHS family MFS transporter [Elusimicrobiota bacterium]
MTDQASLRRVILAASLGTLFEWYDFYLYGSLAVFFGGKFFPPGNETAHLLASLAAFGAGFGVRPLGALVFGHIGDVVGRKYTFLITMATMGLATALVGLLPTYEQIGLWATAALVILRLLQGLALGGEYGGAATYVAEHVPDERRGYYTSYIQTTATLGFFASMGVIGGTRAWMGEDAFKAVGWRLPFLMSFVLLAISLYIRVKMKESPLFSKLKTSGRVSTNPLKESFANTVNLRYVLLALFGATAGQGVVWYTGQFYALTFLQTALKIDWKIAYLIMSAGLAIGTPFILLFGHLSDKIGRKPVMMAGCALAALTYVPIYKGLAHFCAPLNMPAMIGLVALQMVYVAMVYGPIAAFLVELFPTSIRYTSMSLPYHLGNGWFGGFLPLIATALTTSPAAQAALGANAIYAGLIYPIGVCLLTLAVGVPLIRETRGHKIDTAFASGAPGETFDWGAVTIALGTGAAVLLAAGRGFWTSLIGSAALFALPALFLRLEFPRAKAFGLQAACLAAAGAAGWALHPPLLARGGLAAFGAEALLVAAYAALLALAFAAARAPRALAVPGSRSS